MGWFKRLSEGIQTSTTQKKEAPDGLWQQCKGCGKTNTVKELSNNYLKCPDCNHHVRIGSFDYFDLLFDGRYKELFKSIFSTLISCFNLGFGGDSSIRFSLYLKLAFDALLEFIPLKGLEPGTFKN